jgi:predicted HicB family RNase H-like nuclease
MRGSVHSDRLDVRVHPELKAQLLAKARAARMSPAEAVRDALRSYLVGA